MWKVRILSILVVSLLVLGAAGPTLAAEPKSATITGEVIDTFCYALMGAKGPSHRQCGLDCVKAGIPAGLLEDGTGKVYVLLPAQDKKPVPQEAVEKMGGKATITGKMVEAGGSLFLTVESVK